MDVVIGVQHGKPLEIQIRRMKDESNRPTLLLTLTLTLSLEKRWQIRLSIDAIDIQDASFKMRPKADTSRRPLVGQRLFIPCSFHLTIFHLKS